MDGRRRMMRNRIRLTGQLARPVGSVRQLAHRFVKLAQPGLKLPAGIERQLTFLLVEQAVGEGVLARGVSGLRLLRQLLAADHTVLGMTEQGLPLIRPLWPLLRAR